MATQKNPEIQHDKGVVQTKHANYEENLAETLLSPEEEKRLLRKIDLRLLPVMAMSYLFQLLDKTALASTAIMGIQTDLHLKGSEYSWASAIYYFGYLVASYPVAMLMVRWKVGKVIALCVFSWGVVFMLTATCFNDKGLLANRFFLGVFESGLAPGLTIIVSMWYKRSEQPLRHAAWFLGNTGGGIFGSLIMYAISHIHTIRPWKGVFVIFGTATIAWSVGVLLLLPDTPMTAWFLSVEDRKKAVVRVKENMTGIKNDKVKRAQVAEALLDVKSWLIVASQLAANIPNGAVSTFSIIVIQGFGFSTFETLLLGSVSYVSMIVLVLISTGGSSYFRNSRTYFMAFNLFISVAGTAMSGNFGGFTKKTTVNAMSFVAYCCGNIIGPQLFFKKEAPVYKSGFLALMICLAFGFAMCWVTRFYLMWENRRRDRFVSADEVAAFEEARRGVMLNLTDLTDKEIPHFRYVY
uniref:Major facilitator superfamily protein homeolog p n=1 Tax=Epichloe coenophiala TaxID=5047 RepID=A0A346R947_EPICN|nr:major facilitator superfamily protein homeolog p [Epichloe coenophiala]